MPERLLVVPGRYDQVHKVCRFASRAAEEAGLNESDTFHCQLAVDEACTNIIEHAYAGEDQGEIRVACEASGGELTISLTDQGTPFDPTAVPDPAPFRSIEEINVGGYGLYFMRRVMTLVDYTTDGRGNTLTMVKRTGQ